MANERKDISYQIEHGYKLQTLMHKVNKETLKEQHRKQIKNKASGIDNVTKEKYDEDLDNNIDKLLIKMKTFSYVPQPVRRTYIPKANGKLRPLGISAYEDKLVQGAMAEVLNEIYENIFLDCSYGFRPNRSCHDVVRYINQTIMTKKVNYIVEADIKGFFDNVNHDWLMKFLGETIEDKNFLRYIKRFLISGYMEDMKYYAKQTIKALSSGLFSFFAHPDAYLSATPFDMEAKAIAIDILDAAEDCGVPLEINGNGIAAGRGYPSEDFWRLAAERGMPAVISSDAHKVSNLDKSLLAAEAFAEKIGIDILYPDKCNPLSFRKVPSKRI